METYKDLQFKIFGYYDPSVSKGTWKDTILKTAKGLEHSHLLTDKLTSMVKENKLYNFTGMHKHPAQILRMRSLHI